MYICPKKVTWNSCLYLNIRIIFSVSTLPVSQNQLVSSCSVYYVVPLLWTSMETWWSHVSCWYPIWMRGMQGPSPCSLWINCILHVCPPLHGLLIQEQARQCTLPGCTVGSCRPGHLGWCHLGGHTQCQWSAAKLGVSTFCGLFFLRCIGMHLMWKDSLIICR